MSIYEELRGTIYGKEMAVRVAVLYFDPFQCMKTAKLILQGDEICKSTISLGNWPVPICYLAFRASLSHLLVTIQGYSAMKRQMRMNSVPKRTSRNFSHEYCAITCAYEKPYISGQSPSRSANVQILICILGNHMGIRWHVSWRTWANHESFWRWDVWSGWKKSRWSITLDLCTVEGESSSYLSCHACNWPLIATYWHVLFAFVAPLRRSVSRLSKFPLPLNRSRWVVL